MKTLLNLKGLCRSSQLAVNPDSQPTVNRRSRLMSIICLFLLTLGVGEMWGDCQIEGMSNVRLATWENSAWNYREFTNSGDNNHFTYDTYLPASTKYYCQWNIYKYGGSWSNTWYKWDGSNDDPYAANGVAQMCFSGYSSAQATSDEFTTASASSGYTHLYVDYWGTYQKSGWNWKGVGIKFYYAAVNNLSASLTADATSVQGGSTTTVRGGCTGGSGDYGYSYTVTCDGSDVTASVLSGSGENRTFTAPMASTSKTYRVTVTATETNTQLTGLGFTSTNSTYTDITVPGITAPTVTMTVDKVNVNQFTVTGTITNYNGYGSRASDLSEVGFYIGATKYTATYKSGNTFTKTITGLAANTSHANVKAFATNPLTTGYSDTQTVTTLADADYDVKVQVAHGANAPKVYAWTDADSYGGSKMENGTYGSQSASEDKFEATTYDWYTYKLNNKYEKFLIYETGDTDKSGDFVATRTSDCYWYNKSGSPKAAKMTCPEFEPQIVINDGSTETLYEMSGDGTVTRSQRLSAGSYTIKVMYNTEYYGKGSSSIARTGSTSSNSIGGMVVDGDYITLNADFDGDYTFSFNTSTKELTVTYPTAYTVTFTKSIIGGDDGVNRTPTATYNAGATSVTSGDYVPNGTTVAFNAPSAGTGYTFKGWYTIADPSADYEANRVSTTAAYSPSISAAYTAYAVYAEDKHDVAVNKTSGGTISVTSIDDIGVSTTGSVTATADEGYYFAGWTLDDNVTQASLTNNNVTSTITINATADSKTITANFAVRYAIYGSFASSNTGDGMPGWTTPRAFDSYDSENKKYTLSLTGLKPNSRYKLKVLDRRNNNSYGPTGETDIPDGTQWTLNGTVNTSAALHFSTKGNGTYTLTTTTVASGVDEGKPTAKIDMPTSYTVTYGQVTNNGQNGGSISSVVDETSLALSSGGYVKNNGSATFTAGTPTTGYRFVDWRTSNTYGQGTPLSTENPYTMSSITANKTVYAQYAENLCTVTIEANDSERGSVTVAGAAFAWGSTTDVGVYTTKALVATPATGYYFAGWTLSESPDFAVANATEDGASTTLRGIGGTNGSTGTLTANFQPLEIVYFRNWDQDNNRALWSQVYAYFSTYTQDGCAKSNTSAAYYTLMTREGTSNIYWAYVPRGTTRNSDVNIAFSNTDYGTNYKFDKGEAVMRGDYKIYYNTFVPQHSDYETKNSTKYYKGYWKNHNKNNGEDAGYYLKRFNGSSYEDAKGDHKFTIGDDNTIICNLRIDNTTSGYNKYMVAGAAGDVKYITSPAVSYVGPQITSSNFTDVPMQEWNDGSPYFEIIPTSEGNYVLSIDQSGDKMKVSVNYPVSIGDYRLRHSYGTPSTYTYSDIIKAGTEEQTMSMYINTKAASLALSLGQCTAVVKGVPQWEEVKAIGVDKTEGNFDDGSGVYQFTLNNPGSSATLSDIAPYSGQYYIKTDGASGGWANYKQNSMEENTLNYDAKTPEKSFNYYYCKYYDGAGANLKCVIANDYCEALTDTLDDTECSECSLLVQ